MAQTAHGVPYPLPDEPVAEGAARIRDVAEALDSKVLAGRIDWGPAGAPDTNLYRASATNLKTDGTFQAGGSIVVGGNDPNAHIYFGAALDANLYRAAAGVLQTDGTFIATQDVQAYGSIFVGLSGLGAIYFGAAYDVALARSAPGVLHSDGVLEAAQVNARPGAVGQVRLGSATADARIDFGAASDTNLYRIAAGALKTDGQLFVGSKIALNGGDGGVYFGADLSVVLYSSAPQQLTVNHTLNVGDHVNVDANGTGGGRLYFGNAGDASLYRAGAGVIRTPNNLKVDGLIRGTAGASGEGATLMLDNGSSLTIRWDGTLGQLHFNVDGVQSAKVI